MLKLLESKKGTVALIDPETCCGVGLERIRGFSSNWRVDLFTPYEGEYKIQVDNRIFIRIGEDTLYVKGQDADSCIVNLKTKEMIVKRVGTFDICRDYSNRKKEEIIILKNETTDI